MFISGWGEGGGRELGYFHSVLLLSGLEGFILHSFFLLITLQV